MWTFFFFVVTIIGIIMTVVKYPVCGIIGALMVVAIIGPEFGWFSIASAKELFGNLFVALIAGAFLTGIAIGIANIIDGE